MPHAVDGNLYTRELGRAYRAAGCDLIYGGDNLVENGIDVDVLHLQWPEALYRWMGSGPLEERAERFISGLDRLKERGTRVAWTIHNLIPHDHPDSRFDHEVYQRVLERADLLVHHCPLSQKLLKVRYSVPAAAQHLVTPHGHYLAYPHGISRREARARLGIPEQAYVYLQFGAIRGYKGLNTLLDAWRKTRIPNKWLLVAGRYQPPVGRHAWKERLRMLLAGRNRRITLHLHSIPADDIQVYLSAADCMVLTHSRGLNSGVAILGMTFGTLVVGPDMGCIGWVLGQGRNLTYPAGDREALVTAMEQAPALDASAAGAANRTVATAWCWEDMARAVLDHPAMQRALRT
ncbi:MAG TPA: glycosyltransferase [Thiobacillaceae bacterium]|nr:glycosyltransferase [Thiobacillaceae bacterium]HNU64284.1 glycosyltransferase [Thiobacillaceae bacterium]